MKLSVFILFLIFSCAPKQNKQVVKKEQPILAVKTKIESAIPSKLIFCGKIFERQNKLAFANNIYMSLQKKDSNLIKPYITEPVIVSIENSIDSGFIEKTITYPTLNNWSNFLTEIGPFHGISVCKEIKNDKVLFSNTSCGKNNSVSHNTIYLRYIHYENIKGMLILKKLGLYHGN